MSGPLAGLRILDLGTRIGAPFAATLLADLGADVIKVELPGQGDFMRTIGPFVGDYSLFWAVEGRNRRSITLDLRKPDGQVLLRRLAALADVVVENFQPGTLEGWGIGYDALAAVNPGIILTRVSVYGQTGPYRDRPGCGTLAEAMSGFAHITGQPDGPPTLPPFPLADTTAALYATIGVLLCLDRRPCRGRSN